jgi:hypothetical protein
MRNALRRRFWLETVMAIISGVLLVITLIRNNWIEIVFRVDPDNNNGTFEWLIVGALLLVTITLFILASYEWRRARVAIS